MLNNWKFLYQFFLVGIFLVPRPGFAQLQEIYVRAKVQLDAQHTIAQLAALGIEADHGNYTPGRGLTSEFSQRELKLIQDAGFRTCVLIPDVYQWHKTHVDGVQERGSCDGASKTFDYATPVNFTPGTYAGFYRYQEMLLMLDAMQQKYPDLISIRVPISDTLKTHQGRPVFWVRMSDNPMQNESEPEVLYTALHHAREPNSMSQMLFYMWYLLENYATNPEAKYILDNTELYFVPCVNPDGYLRNEFEAPDGGGFWRKNMRDNDDGTFGVDLNRNYGYQWGFDNIGSSPDTQSDVYRGPEAFSEPETRLLKLFCEQHQFQFALNYHTSGNLLIYPWAWSDTLAKPEFKEYANLLTEENNYTHGIATQTVGYQVNGNSDDYMFALQNIMSFTPEVGTMGFWPPISEIEQFTKANVRMNLLTAQLPLRLALPTNKRLEVNTPTQGKALFDLKRFGLTVATFQVSLEPASPAIQSVTTGAQTAILNHLESKPLEFAYTLAPGIKSGDTLRVRVLINNGSYTRTEVIEHIYFGQSIQLFASQMSNLNDWASSDPDAWKLTTAQFFSAPTSCTDSPNGDYLDDAFSNIQLTKSIQIPASATRAWLRYKAKWSLERGYDMAYLYYNSGAAFVPLCATSSVYNVNNFIGEPAYSGYQMDDWSDECADLSALIGQPNLEIGFALDSDEFIGDDGFYFDDVVLEYASTSGITQIPLQDAAMLTIQPNPATTQVRIGWKGLSAQANRVSVTDAAGREVFVKTLDEKDTHFTEVAVQNLPAGSYRVVVFDQSGGQIVGNLAVQK
jgi:carboxypeptidase T